MKWLRTFTNQQYAYSILASNLIEGWFTPTNVNPPYGNYKQPGDTICYQFDFNIPTNEAFMQQGSPTMPKIYWLDLHVQVPGSIPQFGWKTCITNWNDDAVWVRAGEPYNVPPNPAWNELRYPQGHPRFGDSVDLAFRLNGVGGQMADEIKWSQPPAPYWPADAYNGWNEKSVYESDQVVAHDWVCTNATPVTDLH